MKLENLEKAYDKLNKYTINDEARKEINILKAEVKLTIPNETLFDKIVNSLDHRRVILERKADVLDKLYSDQKVTQDLIKDYNKKVLPINVIKNALVTGLIGYTTYTYLLHRSPFLKLPGLVVSLLGIHSITRKVTNDILENQIDRPWKIHTHRVAKGLGPTNVKSEKHEEQFNFVRRDGVKDSDYDYLYKNSQVPEFLSIYERIFKSMKQRPYKFETWNTVMVMPQLEYVKNKTKFSKGMVNRALNTHEDIENKLRGKPTEKLTEKQIQRKLYAHTFRMPTIYQPDYKVAKNTIEAGYAEENSNQRDVLNLRNDYDNILEFADNKNVGPEYEKLINIINTSDEIQKKLAFDIEINKDLLDLKKRVHYLRKLDADENDVLREINSFNAYAEEKLDQFIRQEANLIKEDDGKNKFLIHSDKEIKHLESYFYFINNNKVEMLKNKEDYEEYQDFDFEVPNGVQYNPWDEYKRIYSHLLTKGRKYYIIKSIPEWKFLQLRKPTPLRDDETIDKNTPYKDTNKMDDSIFQIWSLERYHHERKNKENIHHQENTTHRI